MDFGSKVEPKIAIFCCFLEKVGFWRNSVSYCKNHRMKRVGDGKNNPNHQKSRLETRVGKGRRLFVDFGWFWVDLGVQNGAKNTQNRPKMAYRNEGENKRPKNGPRRKKLASRVVRAVGSAVLGCRRGGERGGVNPSPEIRILV